MTVVVAEAAEDYEDDNEGESDSLRARVLIQGMSKTCPSFLATALPTLLKLNPALYAESATAKDGALADLTWRLKVMVRVLRSQNLNPEKVLPDSKEVAICLEGLLTQPSSLSKLSIKALMTAPMTLLSLWAGGGGEGEKVLSRIMGQTIDHMRGKGKGKGKDVGIQAWFLACGISWAHPLSFAAHATTLTDYLTSHLLPRQTIDPSLSHSLLRGFDHIHEKGREEMDTEVVIGASDAISVKGQALVAMSKALTPNPLYPFRSSLFTYDPSPSSSGDESCVLSCAKRLMGVLGDCVDLDAEWEVKHFGAEEEDLSDQDKAKVRLSAAKVRENHIQSTTG